MAKPNYYQTHPEYREYIKEFSRKRYIKNAEKIKKQVQDRVKKMRAFLQAYKVEHGCVDCGYRGHPAALHFDHVRGEKFRQLSNMTSWGMPKVLKEIEKCEVRCANCHSIKTSLIDRPRMKKDGKFVRKIGRIPEEEFLLAEKAGEKGEK